MHPAESFPLEGPAARWQAWWRVQAAAVGPPAAAQGFVLSTPQLVALGVTRSAARHAVQTGRWTAPARGVVCVADLSESRDKHVLARRRHAAQAAAEALRCAGHVVSARSAAILHGLPTVFVPDRAQLTTPQDAGLGISSVHRFGAALDDRSVTRWFGVPVTDVARTLVDLARHDPRDGVMACDAAMREDLVTARDLDRALRDAVGWPGVRRAREVLALGTPLAESPLESLTRWAMHRSGFPTPQLQVVIGGYRVDFLLPGPRLVIEADGRAKYTDDELWREKRREHALRGAGFTVERVIWSDVLNSWPVTERRLWRASQRP